MSREYSIAVCRTEQLEPPVRREIIDLCNAAFQGRESFEPLFNFIPSGGVHTLGRLDGALVSHAVYATRWMQVNEGPLLRCAFVDAVATLPEHWRKGCGAAVMRRLAEEMAAEDFDIGGLCTSTPAFYEFDRLGAVAGGAGRADGEWAGDRRPGGSGDGAAPAEDAGFRYRAGSAVDRGSGLADLGIKSRGNRAIRPQVQAYRAISTHSII